METFTTSTSNADVTYTYEEMVTLTVNGQQVVMPKHMLTALVAVGQGMMLDQFQKGLQ